MRPVPIYAFDKIRSASVHRFRIPSPVGLISSRLRRFRTPTSPISVIPTLHKKNALAARWVALTDTLDPQAGSGRQRNKNLHSCSQQPLHDRAILRNSLPASSPGRKLLPKNQALSALAARYDKLAEPFLGFVCLAILFTLRLHR